MRHNQSPRHLRGRRPNNHGGGGHGQSGGHHHGNQQRRINPRVQTFDSNGPDVRIRGNAFQITEKYLALARDAMAQGDRPLAENYFQHAEHYQRMINEMNEEYARQNPGYNPQQPYVEGAGPQPGLSNEHNTSPEVSRGGPQPSIPDTSGSVEAQVIPPVEKQMGNMLHDSYSPESSEEKLQMSPPLRSTLRRREESAV